MISKNNRGLSCRKFVKLSAAAAQGMVIIPNIAYGSDNSMSAQLPAQNSSELMKRAFGKTNFYVTKLGLGGPATIQWTPQGVVPANIITKAIDLGMGK